MNINNIIASWLKDYESFKFPKYEEFPDIDLYMDQVVTFLERQLCVFQTSSLDKQITPSMINNYVKGDVISAPINKKYNKEHLSLIEEICTLKQVLSIAEIKQIFDINYKNNDFNAFNDYKISYENKKEKITSSILSDISNIKENDILGLTNMALDMAVNAACYVTISKRILFLINVLESQKKEQAERNLKNKKYEDEFNELINNK